MTATAFAPQLDRFEDERFPTGASQPHLRLVSTQHDRGTQHGFGQLNPANGYGVPAATNGYGVPAATNGYGRPAALSLVVPPTGARPEIEIYRRRRFFALVTVTLIVLTVAWMSGVSVLSFGALDSNVGASSAATVAAIGSPDALPAVHVVLPGDSYAAIAAQLGAANPVEAGEQIRAANGGAELVVGQRVVVDVARITAAG